MQRGFARIHHIFFHSNFIASVEKILKKKIDLKYITKIIILFYNIYFYFIYVIRNLLIF